MCKVHIFLRAKDSKQELKTKENPLYITIKSMFVENI